MRLILIILFSWCLSVSAQVIRANSYYVAKSDVVCSNVLDTYTGAIASYSLRKLRTAYSGSAIRVRRSSDNTEQDIGFSGCGLDTSALKSFVGSSNGLVVTWYDQSGSGNNLTQSTAGDQPIIVSSGTIYRLGANPTLYFITKKFVGTAILSGASAASAYVVTAADSDPPSATGAFLEMTGSGASTHQPFSDGVIYDGFCTTSRKTTGNPTNSLATMYLYSVFSTASDWRNYINNTLFYSTGTNTFGNSSFIVGANASTVYQGKISEIIIYNSVSSTGDRNGIAGNINSFYTIY